MFTKVSDLLRDTSLLSSQKAVQTNLLINEAWEKLYIKPKEIKEHSKIKMLKNDVLYISASDGTWAQELQLQKMGILKKINQYIGKVNPNASIKDLVIQVGS